MTSLEARRKAGQLAVGFFAIGVAFALGILFPLFGSGTARAVVAFLPSVGLGLLAGALTAYGLGRAAAVAPWRGPVVAWSSFAMAALGTLVSGSPGLEFKEAAWLVLLGTVPALLLGAIYAWCLRRALRDEGGPAPTNT